MVDSVKKIFFIVIILVIANLTIINPTYASADKIIKDGKEFLMIGKSIDSAIDTSSLKNTSDSLFSILLVMAVIIAVGIGIMLGIKFMASSVEEQAKIKEALVPYVIGCIVIFMAFPVWSIVVNFGQKASDVDFNAEQYLKLTCSCGNVSYSKKSGFDHWKVRGMGEDSGIIGCNMCDRTYIVQLFDYSTRLFKYPKCPVCSKSINYEVLTYNVISENFVGEGNIFKFTCSNSNCKTKLKAERISGNTIEIKVTKQ